MSVEFQEIFARLRAILEPHAARLKVSADASTHYCLGIAYSPKLKREFPVAWIKVGKNYVSFHFMPVYMFPKIADDMSEKLRARMQGKSCFNFKKVDDALFDELRALTVKGLAMAREAGFGP
jgi:hypothetical protein